MKKGGLGYRRKVAGVIVDKKGKFLIVNLKTYAERDWNFPGGGIEAGETEEEALFREMNEELGTTSFKISKRREETVKYDWPEEVIKRRLKETGEALRGQDQTMFLMEFTGSKSEILPLEDEIRRIKWVCYEDLESHFLFPNQWEIAKKVIAEFGLKH